MFLSARRVFGVWIALAMVGIAPLSAIAVSPAHKKFQKSCVWRVTNAKAPFYLVGSIHALSKSDYPLPVPYEIALRNSKRFVFEFDREPTSAPRLIHNFWLGFAKTFSLLKPTPAAESAQELQVSTANSVTSRGGLHSTSPRRPATARVPPRMAWTIISWTMRK